MLVTLGGAPAWAALPGEAQIEDVETSLVNDPSYKVRVEAALVLGRLHQIRSIPVLMKYCACPSGPPTSVFDQAIHRRSPVLVTQWFAD